MHLQAASEGRLLESPQAAEAAGTAAGAEAVGADSTPEQQAAAEQPSARQQLAALGQLPRQRHAQPQQQFNSADLLAAVTPTVPLTDTPQPSAGSNSGMASPTSASQVGCTSMHFANLSPACWQP